MALHTMIFYSLRSSGTKWPSGRKSGRAFARDPRTASHTPRLEATDYRLFNFSISMANPSYSAAIR
jgi:hypothetical protein